MPAGANGKPSIQENGTKGGDSIWNDATHCFCASPRGCSSSGRRESLIFSPKVSDSPLTFFSRFLPVFSIFKALPGADILSVDFFSVENNLSVPDLKRVCAMVAAPKSFGEEVS
jgi:hypothetical protein